MTPLENGEVSGAISEAKFSGAAAVVVVVVVGLLFHTLILTRMCNYTAAGGWCGFKRGRKKEALMKMSMRSCLGVGSDGASERTERGKTVESCLSEGGDGDNLTFACSL